MQVIDGKEGRRRKKEEEIVKAKLGGFYFVKV
jgi:hypothetical protein